MRLSRSLTFTIAVAAALGSAIAVRKAIVTEPKPAIITSTPTTELLVASRAISAGERIQTTDLRWQTWPKDAVPSGAISRDSGQPLSAFDKSYARYPVMEGEPLAKVKLLTPGEGNHVAALIESGKRAVAVPVREENAVGGLIEPNDRVDVLWSSNTERNRRGRPQALTLLRGVKVLAIGKSIHADAARSGSKTATLELTPAQTRIIAGARTGGEISLALIPSGEQMTTASLPETYDTGDEAAPIKVLKFGQGSARYIARKAQ